MNENRPVMLETPRLILRPWREEDAEALYRYASDPLVGPAAGWSAHTDIECSRRTIREVLSEEGIFAVTLRDSGEAVGSIGLHRTTAPGYDGEREIGYWIGRPYWGQGLIPEAVAAMLEHAFSVKSRSRIWCAHFEGNNRSRRVMEKCGFTYAFSRTAEVLGAQRREHYYSITREAWRKWKAI